MTRFAEGTTVSTEKSRAEIEKLIVRYGATSTAFMNGPGRALILFECKGRRIMFELPLPGVEEKRFQRDGRGSVRPSHKQYAAWEQACRQRWRALSLVIKAKLEAVESGITTFEDEFLAHIVMPEADPYNVRNGERHSVNVVDPHNVRNKPHDWLVHKCRTILKYSPTLVSVNSFHSSMRAIAPPPSKPSCAGCPDA